MPRSPRNAELGAFLRQRRAERAPEDVGLSITGDDRRVPGLRRQEVAELASISMDYYTRIEQGRMTASLPVLANLAQALRLSPDEWTYMLKLAVDRPCHHTDADGEPMRVDATVQRLLNDLGRTPAFVIGPHTEVLAWNTLATRVFLDFGQGRPRSASSSGFSSPIRLCAPSTPTGRRSPTWPSISCACTLRTTSAIPRCTPWWRSCPR